MVVKTSLKNYLNISLPLGCLAVTVDMQANKFTVKSRSAKGWPGCIEYVVLDPEQKEHGPFNTRSQANAYVAKVLGIPLKEALANIED